MVSKLGHYYHYYYDLLSDLDQKQMNYCYVTMQEEDGLPECKLPVLLCEVLWYLQQLREAAEQEQVREQVLYNVLLC
jgi:hypothetical protein